MLQLQNIKDTNGQEIIGLVAVCDVCHKIIEVGGDHWRGQYLYDFEDMNFSNPDRDMQRTGNIYCVHSGDCNRAFENAYEKEKGHGLAWGEIADLVIFLGNNLQVDWDKLKDRMRKYPSSS
jgi:hypothetical protein